MVSKFTGIDIHNYRGLLDAYLEKLNLSESICAENRAFLQNYHRSMVNEGFRARP